MIFLKKFKIFESFDVEVLSEYLQEVFDKFDIRETSKDNAHFIEWYISDNIIFINNVPTNKESEKSVDKIRGELKRIQPTIEKRIGVKLVISIGQNGYVPSICWIRIEPFFHKRKMFFSQ